MSEYAWNPPEAWAANAHATALARSLGVDGYHELLALSTEQPEQFWDAVARDLGIPFTTPYERVLDVSDGPEWARWFTGGRLNLAHACVERWADDPAHAGVEAIAWEDEAGATRSLTYAELAREVARFAEGLEALGVRSGDAVALLMPMIPEVAIAYYAIARDRSARRADLLGLLGLRRREPARGLARGRADHGRRVHAPRPSRARQGDGRRGGRARPGRAHDVVVRHTGEPVAWRTSATSGGTSSSTAGPERGARRRSRASTRSCSPTPRARPAGPRAPCTCTAASSSRSPARAATRATCSPATGSTG